MKKKEYTQEQISEIIRLFNAKKSFTEICATLSIPKTSLIRELVKLELYKPKIRVQLPEVILQKISELYQSGSTYLEISKQVQVPCHVIIRYIRKIGLYQKRRGGPRIGKNSRKKEGTYYQRNKIRCLAYSQKYRIKNKEKYSKLRKAWTETHREYLKSKKINLLEIKQAAKLRPCVDCNVQYNVLAMEFDHLPNFTKLFKISHNGIRSIETIKREIAKCDVVCVLCHRQRSYLRYMKNATLFPSKTISDRRKLQLRVNEYKNKPCKICNKQYSPWQMDFDHINPDIKIDKICQMVRDRRPWAVIEDEIKKCQLLCAVCHRLKNA